MTIVWVVFKDFSRLYKYGKNGMLDSQKSSATLQWLILILTKFCYIGYIFVLPLVLTPLLWWQVLLGILIMHYIAGFILAIIFQPAHVTEGTEFPLPDENRTLQNNWAVHQLLTTTNFGNSSRWFSWYVGGLNFQIEHHLFPNICHVHYRKIAAIVKSTAQEFGIPYKSSKTFIGALAGHARLLKDLGKKPVLTPSIFNHSI
jgi:linoleoyl-CoA desaturase